MQTFHLTPKGIPLFGNVLRNIWILIFLLTISAEIVPLPILGGVRYFTYLSSKLVLFALLGFLTPLTFWRFTTLNLSFFVGLSASFAVEIAQYFIPGHAFSFKELFAKGLLLGGGFAFAIVCRYESNVKLGPIRVSLVNPHALY